MAATKAASTIQTSATNTAGSTATSSAVDLTTAYGMLVTAKITNGGTGPTVACSFKVEVSNDNSAWKTLAEYAAGTTASAVYEFAVDVPMSTMYARTVFTGNTGQSVTVEAFGHRLTGI
jgi:hypothetical protein